MNLNSDPIASSDDDYLNRGKTTDYLYKLIKESEKAPLRIGLFGPWGSGKSSIIQLLEKEKLKEDFSVIHFNPWIYSSEDDLINGFNTEIFVHFKFKNKLDIDLIKKSSDLLPNMGAVGLAAGQIGSFLKSIIINKNSISNLIKESKKPVIFVIEDLDRCNPNVIKPFLLYVREVLNLPSVTTIFVSDLSTMNLSLEESSNLQGFFEKIYDYPVFLENLNQAESAKFILKSAECPYPEDTINDYSFLLPNNPRSLKRMCRKFPLMKEQILRFHQEEVSIEQLFIIQTLLLKYPTLAKNIINKGEAYMSFLRDRPYDSNNNKTEKQKLDLTEKSITEFIEKYYTNIFSEEERKAFTNDFAKLYVMGKLYIGEHTKFYANLLTDPVAITEKEIQSFLGKNLSEITIENIISYKETKRLTDTQIIKSLLSFRSRYLDEYCKSYFASQLGDKLKSALKLTELIHLYVINKERYDNELFKIVVGNFHSWGVIIRSDNTNEDLSNIITLEDSFLREAVALSEDKYDLKRTAENILDVQRGFSGKNPFHDSLKTNLIEITLGYANTSFVEKLIKDTNLIGDQGFCNMYHDEITIENLKSFFQKLNEIKDTTERTEKAFMFFEQWLRSQSTFFNYIHNWHQQKDSLKDIILELWNNIDKDHLHPWGKDLKKFLEVKLDSQFPKNKETETTNH